MLRSILAVVLGMVLAFVLIAAIECVNFLLYPPPEGLDMNNHDAMHQYIESLPLTAFLVVQAAYAVGTLGGAWLAATIARRQRHGHGLALGVLLLAASVVNVLSIPHPAWFVALNLGMILPIAWLGAQLASPRR